jgi:hypothetical protein
VDTHDCKQEKECCISGPLRCQKGAGIAVRYLTGRSRNTRTCFIFSSLGVITRMTALPRVGQDRKYATCSQRLLKPLSKLVRSFIPSSNCQNHTHLKGQSLLSSVEKCAGSSKPHAGSKKGSITHCEWHVDTDSFFIP